MSLAGGDLTTVAAVSGYLVSQPSPAVISGLVTRISRTILSDLNRSILVPKTYVDQISGSGTNILVLPNWPVIEFSTLYISGSSVNIAPQANDISSVSNPYGYRFQPWNGVPPGDPAILVLAGGMRYSGGVQNVVATYKAGYQVTDEAATIPSSPFKITPMTPYGSWATDEGVKYSDGQALTAISSGTPLAGQYLPPAPDAGTPRLQYEFAAADTVRAVLISYGYIPGEIEQVALELIAERSSYRNRLGIRSQTLAGQETIVYDNSGFTSYVRKVLAPYYSVLPPSMGGNL